VAHDSSLFADALDVPHGSQSPRESLRIHYRSDDGFPGAAGRLPAECATIGQVLQDNGFSTFWLGKNHNVPTEEVSSGGSKSEWPLQKGFDRFYGFLGGETNNWYPDLVEDNRFITQPYSARGRLPSLEGSRRPGVADVA
jgi:arylsulfatase A-like enzyme